MKEQTKLSRLAQGGGYALVSVGGLKKGGVKGRGENGVNLRAVLIGFDRQVPCGFDHHDFLGV